MVESASVWQELGHVMDPELGVPVTEMGLIDAVEIDEGTVEVGFHLTMPFCPDEFVRVMARDIQERVSALPGVREVRVTIAGHVHADELNREFEAA